MSSLYHRPIRSLPAVECCGVFLNSNIVAQIAGYTLMVIMLRESLNKTPQRTCPNPCPSKINMKFDHMEISDIVSSAVRSALAEPTRVNEGGAQ